LHGEIRQLQPKDFNTLTFQFPPEVFIRRMKTTSSSGSVVHMTELVAAILTVHGSLNSSLWRFSWQSTTYCAKN